MMIVSEFLQESASMTIPVAITAERIKNNPTRETCRVAAIAMPQPQPTTQKNARTTIIKIAAANAPIATWQQGDLRSFQDEMGFTM